MAVGIAVERRAVAEAPDQALHRGRHHLPMGAEQGAVGPEREGGAVERARRAFDHPDDQVEAMVAGDLAEPVRGRARARRPLPRGSAGTSPRPSAEREPTTAPKSAPLG